MNEPALKKKLDIRIQSNPETGPVVKVENLELTLKDMDTIMLKLKKFISQNPGKCALGALGSGLLIAAWLWDNAGENIENPEQGKLPS